MIDLAAGAEKAITTYGGSAILFGMAEFAAPEETYRLCGFWWAKHDDPNLY